MTGIVVADAGPRIALGRVECLTPLHDLYQDVLIPPAVHDELRLGSGRPGARQSAEAFEQGWLQVQEPSAGSAQALSELMLVLDPGEADAIMLAEEVNCKFLLIDERKGRAIANRRGVPVVGIAGVLLVEKKRGLIDAGVPILKNLAQARYRICAGLTKEITRLAEERDEGSVSPPIFRLHEASTGTWERGRLTQSPRATEKALTMATFGSCTTAAGESSRRVRIRGRGISVAPTLWSIHTGRFSHPPPWT